MPKNSTPGGSRVAIYLTVLVALTLSLMGCGSSNTGPLPPGSDNGGATSAQ